MLYRILAELTVAVHFSFILFVALGGLLVAWRPRVAWAHVPCALYGAAISLFGWVCPLTPLENHFRQAAGQAGYDTGFIEHYLLPIIYPGGRMPIDWIWLGVAVIVGNVLIYAAVFLWRGRKRKMAGAGPGLGGSGGGEERA